MHWLGYLGNIAMIHKAQLNMWLYFMFKLLEILFKIYVQICSKQFMFKLLETVYKFCV